VHIPDEETRLSPALLWGWMAAKKITLSFMPTPLAEAVMNEPWPSGLALRALLTGGDTLKRRPPADFPCEVINHYGPTERSSGVGRRFTHFPPGKVADLYDSCRGRGTLDLAVDTEWKVRSVGFTRTGNGEGRQSGFCECG
jgi:non-ribosomal peptide synthetase component F